MFFSRLFIIDYVDLYLYISLIYLVTDHVVFFSYSIADYVVLLLFDIDTFSEFSARRQRGL